MTDNEELTPELEAIIALQDYAEAISRWALGDEASEDDLAYMTILVNAQLVGALDFTRPPVNREERRQVERHIRKFLSQITPADFESRSIL